MPFDIQFIQETLSGVSILSGTCPLRPTFSVDSRTVKPGDIFIALPGVKVDGHAFIEHALRKGAAGIIIANDRHDVLMREKQLLKDIFIVSVPNPLTHF